ncbi:MAG: RNase H family protein [Pirellulaceae bacterium]|nr:RNase H family protein [Pirellulaceae bacterium]
MVVNQPHFLLFTDASLSKSRTCAVADQGFGRWHFVLEQLDGPERLEAADSEADVHRDRLALLAVVRGLEALEQPSQVTLVTTSRYVSRGLRYGLNEWREAEYTWEHFGIQKPIRNADLWQRIDCAMSFHQVTCRLLQSPLVQAMVDTATEMDELTVLTNPIDAPFSVGEKSTAGIPVLENQTAAALARRNSTSGVAAGVIQRVDSAHGLVGMASNGLATSGLEVNSLAVNGPATIVQPNAILHSGDEMAPSLVVTGHSPIVQPAMQLVTELPHGFRRPKISITVPAWRFHRWQAAMLWIRGWRERLLRLLMRVYSRPTVAPT